MSPRNRRPVPNLKNVKPATPPPSLAKLTGGPIIKPGPNPTITASDKLSVARTRAAEIAANRIPSGQVLQRQRLLKSMGYNIVVDGIWGARSQGAWSAYSKFGKAPYVSAQTVVGRERADAQKQSDRAARDAARIDPGVASAMAEEKRKQALLGDREAVRSSIAAEIKAQQKTMDLATRVRADPTLARTMGLRDLTDVLTIQKNNTPIIGSVGVTVLQNYLQAKVDRSLKIDNEYGPATHAVLEKAFNQQARREQQQRVTKIIRLAYGPDRMVAGAKAGWFPGGTIPTAQELVKTAQAGGEKARAQFQAIAKHMVTPEWQFDIFKHSQLLQLGTTLQPFGAASWAKMFGESAVSDKELAMDLLHLNDLTPPGDPTSVTAQAFGFDNNSLKATRWRDRENQQRINNLRGQVAILLQASNLDDFQNRLLHLSMSSEADFNSLTQKIAAQNKPWWGKALEWIGTPLWVATSTGTFELMRASQFIDDHTDGGVNFGINWDSDRQTRDVMWEDAQAALMRPLPDSYDDLTKPANRNLIFAAELIVDPLNYIAPFKAISSAAKFSSRGAQLGRYGSYYATEGVRAGALAKTAKLGSYTTDELALVGRRKAWATGDSFWNQAIVYEGRNWTYAGITLLDKTWIYQVAASKTERSRALRTEAYDIARSKIQDSQRHLHEDARTKLGLVGTAKAVAGWEFPTVKLNSKTKGMIEKEKRRMIATVLGHPQTRDIYKMLENSRASVYAQADRGEGLSTVGASMVARYANWADLQVRHRTADKYARDVIEQAIKTGKVFDELGVETAFSRDFLVGLTRRVDTTNRKDMRAALLDKHKVSEAEIAALRAKKPKPLSGELPTGTAPVPDSPPIAHDSLAALDAPSPQQVTFKRNYSAFLKDWNEYIKGLSLARDAGRREYSRVLDKVGYFTAGGGDAQLMAEVSAGVIPMIDEFENTILPIMQGMLEDASAASYKAAQIAANKLPDKKSGTRRLTGRENARTGSTPAAATFHELEVPETWDLYHPETGVWSGHGGNHDALIKKIATQSFDEARIVKNPMLDIPHSAAQMADAINGEVRRSAYRTYSNMARRNAVGETMGYSARDVIEIERKKIEGSWAQKEDGQFYDIRPTLEVSSLYARHLDELKVNAFSRFDDDIQDSVAGLAAPPWQSGVASEDGLGRLAWDMGGASRWPVLSRPMVGNNQRFDPRTLAGDEGPQAVAQSMMDSEMLQRNVQRMQAVLLRAYNEAMPHEMMSRHAWWRAISEVETGPLKVAYTGLNAALSTWIFATLTLRPGWVVRNQLDNTAKAILRSVRDPRLLFNGGVNPGGVTRSVFDSGIRDLMAAAKFLDGLFGTEAAHHFQTIVDQIWGLGSGILDRIFVAHGMVVPPAVIESRFSSYVFEDGIRLKRAGRPHVRSLDDGESLGDPELDAIVRRYSKQHIERDDPRFFGSRAQLREDIKAGRDAMIDMMGNRPEAYMRRVIYRSEVLKESKRLTALRDNAITRNRRDIHVIGQQGRDVQPEVQEILREASTRAKGFMDEANAIEAGKTYEVLPFLVDRSKLTNYIVGLAAPNLDKAKHAPVWKKAKDREIERVRKLNMKKPLDEQLAAEKKAAKAHEAGKTPWAEGWMVKVDGHITEIQWKKYLGETSRSQPLRQNRSKSVQYRPDSYTVDDKKRKFVRDKNNKRGLDPVSEAKFRTILSDSVGTIMPIQSRKNEHDAAWSMAQAHDIIRDALAKADKLEVAEGLRPITRTYYDMADVAIQMASHDKAIKVVNDTLFDYGAVSVIEDNFRFFLPFVQFWRKNTVFWMSEFVDKPWLPLGILKLEQEIQDRNVDLPSWSKRYTTVVTDALASVPGLSEVFGLTGLDDTQYDPMNFFSFAPIYRAITDKPGNQNLTEEEKGNRIFGPVMDAISDWGLGWNPFVRKGFETAGVANHRSWQSIFPQTPVAVALTRKYWGERAAERVADWERIFTLFLDHEDTPSDQVARDFNNWVQMEMVGQQSRGETPDRKKAEDVITDWFILKNVWGYFSGMYARRANGADVFLSKLQDDVLTGERPYADNLEKYTKLSVDPTLTPEERRHFLESVARLKEQGPPLTDAEKKLYQSWSMKGADRLSFDRYMDSLPFIEAYYKQPTYEAKQLFVQQHPAILQYVSPAWKGRPFSDNFLSQAQNVMDTDTYFKLSEIAQTLDLPFADKQAAMSYYLTPELEDFWAKNDTPVQHRERMIQGVAFDRISKAQAMFYSLPETDHEARNSFIDSHPEMVRFWNRNNSVADNYHTILNSANADLRSLYFDAMDRGGFDLALPILKAHPFMFEGTKSEDKIDEATGEWKTRTAGGGFYRKNKAEIQGFFDLLHRVGKQKAFEWLRTSRSPEAEIVREFFEKYGKNGGKKTAKAIAYLAAKPFLDAYFKMPKDEAYKWLHGGSEGAALVQNFFDKYAHQKGNSQHGKDYLAVKTYLDYYGSLSTEAKKAWLASDDPNAALVLAFFKKYGKVNQQARAFENLNPDLVGGTPELRRRLVFWKAYYALPPDAREAYMIQNGEDYGVFAVSGFMGDTEMTDEDMAFKRRALGAGLNEKQSAFLMVRPLLDFFKLLKDPTDKDVFLRSNPLLQLYFNKYSTHSVSGNPALDKLVEAYFALPEGSQQRSEFLRANKEIQDYFDKRSTPAERAMRNLLEQYFALSSRDKKDFLTYHPEIQGYFDQRKMERENEQRILLAFDQADPRLKPYWAEGKDLIRGADLMRKKLRDQALKALQPDTIGSSRDGRQVTDKQFRPRSV